MPKVTVIMPCLNMVKYIRQCIESVVHQTLDDIEILVIDAGSVDGTVEIIEEYVQDDTRVHLISSDKKSYGYQVNMGITMAKGEYIGVVDTDDYIALDMYEQLYQCAKMYELDYCKGMGEGFIDISGLGRHTESISVFEKNENMLDKMIVPADYPDLLIKDCYLWNGIYRNEFVKSIKLNETPGAAYQDLGFIFQVYSKAQKAIYMDKVVYYYRKDNPSASGYDKRAFSYLVKEYSYVEELLKDKDKQWVESVYEKMLLHCHSHFKVMAITGKFWEEARPDIEILKEKLLRAVQEGLVEERRTLDFERKFQLFISNTEECFEYYVKELEEKKNSLKEAMAQICDRTIVIFGSGRLGRFMHVMMFSYGYGKVEAYCDNSKSMQGKEILNTPILSPQDAVLHYPNCCYVVANKNYAEDMRKQLLELGISDNNICLYTAGTDNLSFYGYYMRRER